MTLTNNKSQVIQTFINGDQDEGSRTVSKPGHFTVQNGCSQNNEKWYGLPDSEIIVFCICFLCGMTSNGQVIINVALKIEIVDSEQDLG